VVAVRPNYTSQFLSYRDEKVFTDCNIREYWDEIEQLLVDRDINAAVSIKRVGLGLFLTINSRSGKIKVSHTQSTAMEVLRFLREFGKPTLTRRRAVCGSSLSQEQGTEPPVDASQFFLFIESARIKTAFDYDPHFAVSLSGVRPLPHQLEARSTNEFCRKFGYDFC